MKKFKVLMLSLVLAAVPFLVQSQPAGASTATKVRLAGANRTLTAIAVAESGWPNGASTVVLTRDDAFPDALAGAPLASMNNAPILLTNSQTLSSETAQEIVKLHPTKIIILGGTGVVSTDIQNTLEQSYKIPVDRIGGKDRFDTAAQIAQRVGNVSGKVVVAYGLDYPDALAVSPWAAKNGVPILLSLTDTLPAYTSAAIQQLKPSETVVVGGSGVVSDAVKNALPNATRYSGSNRYQTAADICTRLGKADGTQLNPSNVFVATGLNWPDALGGSALAGKDGNPIILTGSTLDPTIADYIYGEHTAITKVTALGGAGVVSDGVIDEVLGLVQDGNFNDYLQKYNGYPFGATTLDWSGSGVYSNVYTNTDLEIDVYLDKATTTWDSIKANNQADLETYIKSIVADAEKEYPSRIKNISLYIVTYDNSTGQYSVRAQANDYSGNIVVEFDPALIYGTTSAAPAVKSFSLSKVSGLK